MLKGALGVLRNFQRYAMHNSKGVKFFPSIFCESFVSSIRFGDGQNFIIGLIHHHLRKKISNKCCRTSRQSLSLRYEGMWISTHILQLKLIFLWFSCRSVKMDVYRHKLAARQAACTNRKFHGNRVLPRVLWRSLTERILINHYIYIMGHKLSHARDVSGSVHYAWRATGLPVARGTLPNWTAVTKKTAVMHA